MEGVENWKEAVERSKIKRVNWKFILGKSLTAYIRDNKYITNEELTKEILRLAKEKEYNLNRLGFSLDEVADNLKISLSARRAEQKIYGVK